MKRSSLIALIPFMMGVVGCEPDNMSGRCATGNCNVGVTQPYPNQYYIPPQPTQQQQPIVVNLITPGGTTTPAASATNTNTGNTGNTGSTGYVPPITTGKVTIAVENSVIVIKNISAYSLQTFFPPVVPGVIQQGTKFLFGYTYDKSGNSWFISDLNNIGTTPYCIVSGTDCVSNMPAQSGNEFNAYTIINGVRDWINIDDVKPINGVVYAVPGSGRYHIN